MKNSTRWLHWFICVSLTWLHAQWTSANLSTARYNFSAASGGDKAMFAGGIGLVSIPYDFVDVYEGTSATWTGTNLSVSRTTAAATSCGTKIFLPEARMTESSPILMWWICMTAQQAAGRLCLWVLRVQNWLRHPEAVRFSLPAEWMMVRACVTKLWMFDTATGVWTTTDLSVPRYFLQAPAREVK